MGRSSTDSGTVTRDINNVACGSNALGGDAVEEERWATWGPRSQLYVFFLIMLETILGYVGLLLTTLGNFGPTWAGLGAIWVTLGALRATLGHFWPLGERRWEGTRKAAREKS